MKKFEFGYLDTISAEHLRRVLEMSIALSATLDTAQLFGKIIETAMELTATEAASILLLDEAAGHLYLAASSNGMRFEDEELVFPIEGSVAGMALESRKPLLLEDLPSDPRAFAEIETTVDFSAHDMLAMPLVTNGRAIGTLEVINKRGQGRYSDEDQALLRVLASQATVAIENARLFQQTDLIAELMHELKTPLLALTAASEILDSEDLPPKQRELMDMVGRETARLSKMARDFLELARLESGRVHLARERVDLRLLVNEVLDLQKSQAASRNINILCKFPDESLTFVGDFDRLKQVLLNLTSNAIKYCDENGKVTVSITELPGEVAIGVSDDGPGIPPESIPHLFERFYRVPDSEGFTEGTGLGLPIARRIVEEHNGRIEVNSKLGVGSSFCCYLPL